MTTTHTFAAFYGTLAAELIHDTKNPRAWCDIEATRMARFAAREVLRGSQLNMAVAND